MEPSSTEGPSAFARSAPDIRWLRTGGGAIRLDAAALEWEWFKGASAYRPATWYRAAEIVIAAAGLVASAPLMLILAILIRFESTGPSFFIHDRLTTGRRVFRFVKLRTMYVDWDRRFPELSPDRIASQHSARIRLSTPDDPRVTPLGRWLRRTSLDELPNLWHVLTGDMALVGPRPEIPEMLPHYRGPMLEKFSVPPGLTGYAQIRGRGDLPFIPTVEQDLRYVQERSLAVDLRVLGRTIVCVLRGQGAY